MPFICIHCRSKIDPKFKACPHCGEPITDFLRRHLDEPVDGKYQLLSRLAIGGMGEVYKALHIHLNALRVIKLQRSGAAGDGLAGERFTREARLATKINHPNVATLYDFAALDDGSQYMVWEYIDGINLHDLIATRGPLAPRYAAELAIQALHGLEAVHKAGIIHRDISPENLMITRGSDGEEHVKVIDLGIARSALPDDTNTRTGGFVGKWKYCSPEHLGVLAPGERIDARADLYSFGAVLFEMLAGAPPFQADLPHEYVMLHSSVKPPALREVNPTVAELPELEQVIQRAMEKERDARFGSAAELASALEALLPTLPETGGATSLRGAPPETTLEATQEASGRRRHEPKPEAPAAVPVRGSSRTSRGVPRWAVGTLAAAAVVTLVIAAAWLFSRRPEVPSSPPIRRPAVAAAAAQMPGHVGINAYPWGEVIRIRNVDTGRLIPTTHPLTPTSVSLAAGVWEITLTNPSYREPLSVEVIVAAGTEQIVNAHFADPRLAPMPDFGGAD